MDDNRRARLTAVIAAVVAVLAVVALVVTTYRGGGDGEPVAESTGEPVQGTPAPRGPEDSATTPTEVHGDDESDTYTPDPKTRKAILTVTTKFVDAWRAPGKPAQRTKRIKPYAIESLTAQLANVDPANLPKGDIKGAPVIKAPSEYAAATEVTFTTGQRIRCNLVLRPDGWRVSEVLPVTDPRGTPDRTPPSGTDDKGADDQATEKGDPSAKPGGG